MSSDVSPRPRFKASAGTRLCSLIESAMSIGCGYLAFAGEWLLFAIVAVGMFGMGTFTFAGLMADYEKYRAELDRKEVTGNE